MLLKRAQMILGCNYGKILHKPKIVLARRQHREQRKERGFTDKVLFV